jgi:hypothetical protein
MSNGNQPRAVAEFAKTLPRIIALHEFYIHLLLSLRGESARSMLDVCQLVGTSHVSYSVTSALNFACSGWTMVLPSSIHYAAP